MAYEQSQAWSSHGGKLEVWPFTQSPAVPKEVHELVEWNPQGSKLMSDPTNLSSTYEEEVPILPNAGRVQSSMNRVSNSEGQLLLQSAYDNDTLLYIRRTMAPNLNAGQTTGDVFLYTGYVTQFDPSERAKNHVVNNVAFRLVRRVSFTAGS